MKRFYGIDMQCVRHTEETMNRSAHPTEEKKKAIIDAFQHLNLISQDQIMGNSLVFFVCRKMV